MERSGERSGTLGNSYQLGSALKERQKLPAKKRASFVVPFCSSLLLQSWTLYIRVFLPHEQLTHRPLNRAGARLDSPASPQKSGRVGLPDEALEKSGDATLPMRAYGSVTLVPWMRSG